ncbi:ataxin-3-like isoform X2 [Dysidea avara]|uniref:ataxin-3-like isoform X2 n=1 Tax=Dysidea avara TaxID=196820 RepID=UPI00331E49E7
MDKIFHEKQDGSLCAQHCLNSLLQGPYFTPIDLANFARELDEAERERMAEGDTQSVEFLKYMQQPSANMDDSGFFSVQVLSRALTVWNLELLPLQSKAAQEAQQCPQEQKAFICHLDEHWFTIRKFASTWVNLDSLCSAPEEVSDTHLSLFLAQLQNDGYSIFVVAGDLPVSEADREMAAFLAKNKSGFDAPGRALGRSDLSYDTQLALAISASLNEEPSQSTSNDAELLRQKRLDYFSKK